MQAKLLAILDKPSSDVAGYHPFVVEINGEDNGGYYTRN
jgi:hypothetical protein